ncbi:MAG TPA: MFS transporter [Anaeromyxobacteraceae bacterium]|nr:MFS transporter [Anaeromyxobacteraceae bacterium]
MTQRKPRETAPEDRIPNGQMVAYGMGAIANNLLGGAIGYMSIVLNVGLGMNPALVGTLQAIPRFWDALADPVMGFVSDNTRSRYGRRRPYILVGAILVGISFALMWQLPPGHGEKFYFWVFLGSSIVFYTFYTVFAAPWVALGYEMTPDYHERTRLMAVMNFMGQFAWISLPWSFAIMSNERLFVDSVQGARVLAIVIGVVVVIFGVMPALFCRERTEPAPEPGGPRASGLARVGHNVREFVNGFVVTLRRVEFLKLCGGTFFLFNGIMLIGAFGSYITIYYVCGGDTALGGTYMGLFGTISTVSTLISIALVTWVSKRIGKRATFMLATAITLVGSLLKWPCYDPLAPWKVLLPAPFIAVGMGALFTLMGSMIADVCDLDALESGQRREGMFGAVYWWMVKLGMALAFGASGYLLNATGFDVELGGAQTSRTFFLMRVFDVVVPAVAAALSIALVASYKITEARAHEIREETERRRRERTVAGLAPAGGTT